MRGGNSSMTTRVTAFFPQNPYCNPTRAVVAIAKTSSLFLCMDRAEMIKVVEDTMPNKSIIFSKGIAY